MPKKPVSPLPNTRATQNEYLILRDPGQKKQRLVKVRKTAYKDPGNPFGSSDDGHTEVLLEQKPNEDSKTFMNRSSQWFFAHEEVQQWLGDSESVPSDITWEPTGPSTAIPPVPAIPEDLKSDYVPARAGWTTMRPMISGNLKQMANPGLSPDQVEDGNPFDEKRDTEFYNALDEIEDIYLQDTPVTEKFKVGKLKT